jgi:hypothetical protein
MSNSTTKQLDKLMDLISQAKTLGDEKGVERLLRLAENAKIGKAPDLAKAFEEKVNAMPRQGRPAWGSVAVVVSALYVGVDKARSVWNDIKDHRAPWGTKVSAMRKACVEGSGPAGALSELQKWVEPPENPADKVARALQRLREALRDAKIASDEVEGALRVIAEKIAPTPATTATPATAAKEAA